MIDKLLPSIMFCFDNVFTDGKYSTLIVVLAVFGRLLFEALHSKILPLSVLFPEIFMYVAAVPARLVMSLDPRCQVIFGAGTALLLTKQRTSIWELSLMVSGLSLGLMETLYTSIAILSKILELL